MARTLQTRKRSRPLSFGTGKFKRRRTTRRRFSKKSSSLTSKAGYGSQFGYRSKKVSRKRWKNMIWNATLQKTHYRSLLSVTAGFLTPANSAQVQIHTVGALPVNSGAPFWGVAGGAQPESTGIAVPNFDGKVVLRGGMVGIRLVNQVIDSSPVQASVFLISPVNDAVFINNVSRDYGWDPSIEPDFIRTVGKIIYRRSFLIENSNVVETRYRVGIKTFDPGQFTDQLNQLRWMVVIGNAENAVAVTVTTTRFHNLSFSADAT